MSPALETTLLLIGPILSLIVMMLIATIWRRLLASDRAIVRRLEALETRMTHFERPSTEPSSPKMHDVGQPRVSPRRVDSGRTGAWKTGPIAANLISVPDLSWSGEAQTSAAPDLNLNGRFGSVWDLAEAGASSEAIARATGHPIGQVELILGLKRQSETTQGGPRLPGTH